MPTILNFDEINRLYFSTMQIPESEKQERIQLAKKFYKLLVPYFEKQKETRRLDAETFTIMEDVYVKQLSDIYKTATSTGTYDTWANLHADKFARDVTGSTMNWKRGSPNNAFTEVRAKEISLNEANLFFNQKAHSDKARKHQYHVWHAHRDERTRKPHYLADGQIRPINEPFDIGGYKMMFPMDDSLGAPPEMIVNCRCTESFR